MDSTQEDSNMGSQQPENASIQGSQSQPNQFRQAFHKHRALLKQHLGIWQMVDRDARPGSAMKLTAQACLQNTRSMIQACASIQADNGSGSAPLTYGDTTNTNGKHVSEEPQTQPATKRTKKAKQDPVNVQEPAAVAPVQDASGLFTIDPNPTAVNELLNDFNKAPTSKKGKRRRSEQGLGQPQNDDVNVIGGGPATKRVKTEHEKTVKPSAEEVEEHEKSFEAKVALRLKQKEQARQKKAIKKRKRESDGTEEVGGGPVTDGEEHRESTGPQGPDATTQSTTQANIKRARRAAAYAARADIREELAAEATLGTKRKGTDTIDVEGDDAEDVNYGGQPSRKKRKPRTRKPKTGPTQQP